MLFMFIKVMPNSNVRSWIYNRTGYPHHCSILLKSDHNSSYLDSQLLDVDRRSSLTIGNKCIHDRAMSCKPRHINKFGSFITIALGGTVSFGALLAYRGDEKFYSKALMPVLSRYIDPELAHDICIKTTRYGLIRCRNLLTDEQAKKLKTTVFNLQFENPIGLAAGFDKSGYATPGLKHYGLGFAEVGTVTPRPQDGNPKKRIFRIPGDRALINRCGFNNDGLCIVEARLKTYKNLKPMVVGLNLGNNKDSSNPIDDYLHGLRKTYEVIDQIDYYVINISSPNTPGLRDTQQKKNLESMLDKVLELLDSMKTSHKPLLLKIAPDLTDEQIKDIATVITTRKYGKAKIDGIILTNTTVSRPEGKSDANSVYQETGGLSGQPLRDMSTNVIRKFYKLTDGKIPIIGVGGISSGQDAYDKIRAGASLIQLYTAMTYDGPPVVNRIKRELVELLERDQLNSISDAVGLDSKGS